MPGRVVLDLTNPSLDANGVPISGATLTFYEAGKTTLGNIYSARDLDTPLQNPLPSTSGGRFPDVWANDNDNFDVLWKNGSEALIRTFDDIAPFSEGDDPADLVPLLRASGGDDTETLQAALDVGGAYRLEAAIYNFTNLTIVEPVRLIGAVASLNTPATILNCTAADDTDKITVGDGVTELYGVSLEHLVLANSLATGGDLLSYDFVAQCGLHDIVMANLAATEVAARIHRFNQFRASDVRIIYPNRAGFLLSGTDSERSDVFDILNCAVSGDSASTRNHMPAGIERDGFVNTISGTGFRAVGCDRGIWCHNAIGATARAQFIKIHDCEIDFPDREAVRLEYGDSADFTAGYFHGSLTAQNIWVGPGVLNTADNVSFVGGECTGAFKEGMYLDGRYIRVVGMEISTNSQQSSGTHPGVLIGADAIGVLITGNHIGERSGAAAGSQSYGVKITSGAQDYVVQNNDLRGNVTGAVQELANGNNSVGVTGPNIGQAYPASLSTNIPVSGFSITFDNYARLTLLPAGTLATGTITMPAKPYNGQPVSVFSTQEITALTLSPNSGQFVNGAPTTLLAGGGFEFTYNASNATWYRTA